MKKGLLAAALLTGSMAMAQLPDGSIAPDFTVTDINGNTHDLYDYLDNGYTVVMDVSATWCGPCWSYHQNGVLEDLWTNHGPAGEPGVSASTTDDVVVLWFEADGSTTLADLNGTGGNTQGDWVTGTDFPIIDDASIGSPYAIAYFPTLYTICPNRVLTETGQISSASAYYTEVGNCPSANAGTDIMALSHNGDEALCGAGNVSVTVDIQNSGSTAISAATVEVYDGATMVGSQNYSGNLSTWDIATVNVGNVSVSGATTLDIVVTTSGDADASNNTIQKVVDLATLAPLAVDVRIYTDNYPSETTWELRNSSNAVVASGGPYNPGTDDQWGGGGADALTEHVHNVTLPAGVDCYSMVLYDSFGDGMIYGTNTFGQIGARITTGTTTLLDWTDPAGWDFGNDDTREAAIRTDAASSIEVEFANAISIYPNPVSNNATIQLDNEGDAVVVEVYNAMGAKVMTNDYGRANTIDLEVSSLANGMYTVRIIAGNKVATKKITVSK